MAQTEIKPPAARDRKMGTLDLILIWFGASIAITEIWAGGLPELTTLGLMLGLVAIIIGRVIGNGLMAGMARIGSDTGFPTMVLTRPAFGLRGSYIPALFNILQLIGWTGWMLFVGFLYMDILAAAIGLPTSTELPAMRYVWVITLGVFCTLWAMGGSRFWQVAQRIGAVLLLLLTLGLTIAVFQQYDVAALWQSARVNSLSFSVLGNVLGGTDIVIAMSVSWLPLVADYSRYARKPRSGSRGTFWGYFIGGTWMYAVGLLVALATGTGNPDQTVMEVISSQGAGWAIAAVVLVLISTVTTTFLDIFSTVVSTQNLWPRFPEKSGNLIVGALGTATALLLDVFAYEPFLLAIGAIFLPAFTVVLTDYYVVAQRRVMTSQVGVRGGSYWYTAGFNWRAITAWVIGFVVYDFARGFPSINFFLGKLSTLLSASALPVGDTSAVGTTAWAITVHPLPYGASLPCILATAIAYLLLVRMFKRGVTKKTGK